MEEISYEQAWTLLKVYCKALEGYSIDTNLVTELMDDITAVLKA